LVTTSKNINNTLAITKKLLGKRVPAAMDSHEMIEVLLDYNNGNGVFMWFVRKCYQLCQLSSRVDSWQLAVGSWKLTRALHGQL
jgi:hypothetical protein